MKEEKIRFTSYDGYELEGYLLKAEAEKGALLFVHGISSDCDELGFHSDYAKYLSRNGITTLRFDYRYHGKHKTSLEQLTLGGIVNDIDAAFAALKKHTGANLKNYFIIGTSFGGGLSAYWASRTENKELKKVILNAPVINYEYDVLGRNKLVKDGKLSSAAQKQLDKKGFVLSSDIQFGRGLINELNYINGIHALKNLGDRVVIFHGDEDEDVPIASSEKYKTEFTHLEKINHVGHGFGVEGDEDLNFTETKQIHQSIYQKALSIIESAL